LINAKNGSGDTALHILAKKGYKGATIWVRLHGADMKVKNNQCLTPLDLARRYDDATTESGVEFAKCLDWNEPDPKEGCILL
jgi:hypothetical protein